MRSTVPLLSVLCVLALAGPGRTQDDQAPDDAATIASAETAAPAAIAAGATIYGPDMRVLREGGNGWWCMPDDPGAPDPDQMCGDANAMERLRALIEGRDPPEGKVRIGYSFMGAAVASIATPFAPAPASEEGWIWAPPHIAVFNDPAALEGYPHEPDPEASRPFVMGYDRPYAHLMLPIG